MKENPCPKNREKKIAIAGGGLLGRLLAWKLKSTGMQIDLFEAGHFFSSEKYFFQQPKAAAFTAAGMVAPLSEAVVSDFHTYQMGQFALKTWPLWLQEMGFEKKYFHYHGSLVIAHPQDHAELIQFERELNYLNLDSSAYEKISTEDIQTLEPDLSNQFQQGLFLKEEGHIDNRELLAALEEKLVTMDVKIHEQTPVNCEPQTILAGDQKYHFDWVIDCRGLGAKKQIQGLRGVRGETLRVETKEIHLSRPVRLMHPRYQLYVVPKPNHQFVIGATQIESEDLSPISLQSSLELSSALYTLSPAFAEARILEADVNLRPALADNLPKIDFQKGLISINGLFRHGYLVAPWLVNQTVDYLQQQ